MVSRRVLLHLFILTLSLYPLSVMSLCRPTFAVIAWKLIQEKTSRPPDCPANAWNRCRLCLTRNWKRGLHFSSSEPLATFLLPHPPPWENHLSWCPTNKKDQTNLTRSSQPPATLPLALSASKPLHPLHCSPPVFFSLNHSPWLSSFLPTSLSSSSSSCHPLSKTQWSSSNKTFKKSYFPKNRLIVRNDRASGKKSKWAEGARDVTNSSFRRRALIL